MSNLIFPNGFFRNQVHINRGLESQHRPQKIYAWLSHYGLFGSVTHIGIEAKAFMKWNFYWIFINILTSGKFLEFLGIEFETSLVYCHSFSFSNNVCWMVSCNKIPRDSKVSFFLQCSKVRLIPLKKFNIQACFFHFLWFFRLKCWFQGQITPRIHLILSNAYTEMCFDRNINGNRDFKILIGIIGHCTLRI